MRSSRASSGIGRSRTNSGVHRNFLTKKMPGIRDGAMQPRDRLILFFSTGGYVGRAPLAPGTFGSFVGIPIAYAVHILFNARFAGALFLTILFIAAAVRIAGESEKLFGRKDASPIVIDEIAGYMVTLLGLPFNLATVTAGFFFFRVLDILKPFPIRWLERRLPGGFGVVLDDVAAGIYGNLLLRVFLSSGFLDSSLSGSFRTFS